MRIDLDCLEPASYAFYSIFRWFWILWGYIKLNEGDFRRAAMCFLLSGIFIGLQEFQRSALWRLDRWHERALAEIEEERRAR